MDSEIELKMKESRRSRRIGSSRKQEEHCTQVYTEEKSLARNVSENSNNIRKLASTMSQSIYFSQRR